MKNLDPKRREHLRQNYVPNATDPFYVSIPMRDFVSLLDAAELLDAAMAENRAWRKRAGKIGFFTRNHYTNKHLGGEAMPEADATDTLAARLGWDTTPPAAEEKRNAR